MLLYRCACKYNNKIAKSDKKGLFKTLVTLIALENIV